MQDRFYQFLKLSTRLGFVEVIQQKQVQISCAAKFNVVNAARQPGLVVESTLNTPCKEQQKKIVAPVKNQLNLTQDFLAKCLANNQ